MPDLHQLLRTHFGFDRFRPGQEEAVRRALAGKHTLLVMPAGAGKALACQLPALILPGLTLVISPLVAAIRNRLERLVAAGLPATYLSGSLPQREADRRLRAVRAGQVKLLYLTPEGLRHRATTAALAKSTVSLLAVEAAHCLSPLSHDFRPEYRPAGPIWQAMGRPPLLATSDAATPQVQRDILARLGAEPGAVRLIVTGFNRPNLTYQVRYTPDDRAKLRALAEALGEVEGTVLIYAATRRQAEEVAGQVCHLRPGTARAFHAGLDRDARRRIGRDFEAGRLSTLVATHAAGLGVDRPDVRLVVHYHLPASLEAYYQEAGQAGRDALSARCLLLFGPQDQRLQEWLILADTPGVDDLHHLHGYLTQAASDGEAYAALPDLATAAGLHPIKVRAALSELEQSGALFHLGDEAGYSHWRVAELRPEALAARIGALTARRERRQRLLAHMVAYAQTAGCRRRFLLNYFGDGGPAEARDCCDNHDTAPEPGTLPRAETPAEWEPLIILETVRTLRPAVGRKRLAQILAGSQARAIRDAGYQRHRFYGKLARLRQRRLVELIDRLLERRYLQVASRGAGLPVLELTPAGRQALEARAALPIALAPAPVRAGAQSAGPDGEAEEPVAAVPPAEHGAAAGDDPARTLVTVIAALPGRLTPTGAAFFLAGAPEEVAPFCDHRLHGALHGRASVEALTALVEEMLARRELTLTAQGRLLVGE